jgi:hypothetical protein
LAVLLALQALAALASRDLVLVLDNSGSMRRNDPGRLAPSAVAQFIERQPVGTRIAVVLFADSAELVTPLTPVGPGTAASTIFDAHRLDYRGRWTQTAGAVERALYELRLNGRPDAERAVVVMTDGLIDTGDPRRDAELSVWLRDSLAPQAGREGVQVYGLAFTERADFLLLQSVATATGAEYFRALRPDDIDGALRRIEQTLGNRALPPPAAAPAQAGQAQQPAPQAAERIVFVPPVEEPRATGDAEGWLGILGWSLALLATAALGWFGWTQRDRLGALASAARSAAPSAAGLTAVLYDVYDAADIKRHEIGDKPVVIGRVSGSDPAMDYVVVDERTVGRWHATIERRGQTFWLRDEGSVNGTFINDQRITGEHPLKHGDMVRVHRHEFEFVIPELFDSDRTMIGNATQMAPRGAEASGSG